MEMMDKLSKPLNVLLTNYTLENYTGTEVVVRDLALELKRQGHQPFIYTRKAGRIARELADRSIQVVCDLAALALTPHIIHGHHHPTIMEALLRFPNVPAVSVCHDASQRIDDPIYFPRILRYVAVDNRCRNRIERAADIPPSKIEVILNAADLDRFRPREPLPPKPARALVFSNRKEQLAAVRKACKRMGLMLDVLGGGTAAPNPELILPRYDIVFAKARCALEAMAVGNAVVLCDFSGVGPLVTAQSFNSLRWMNFGQGVLGNPLESKHLEREIARYDPVDAATVSGRVRSEAGLVDAMKHWIELYRGVIAEFCETGTDAHAEFHAIAHYVRNWSYESRVAWERKQVARLQRMPILGNLLYRVARASLLWWTRRATWS